MKVFNKRLVNSFSKDHADARDPLRSWIAELEDAVWQTPIDLKKRYPSASVLGGKRIVFNIKGNNYRALTLIDYQSGFVIIKKIGTHAEYEKWDL